jgi:hypothetical protein
MSEQQFAPPAYQGKARLPSYYENVDRILAVLHRKASLATIADHMNRAGITSPRGKPWCKATVANYMRRTSL